MRIAFLEYQGGLLRKVDKAFRKKGDETLFLSLEGASFANVRERIESFRPEMLVMANLLAFHWWKEGAALEDYLRSLQTPVALWCWEKVEFCGDPQLKERLKNWKFPEHFHFFVTDRSDLKVMEGHGAPVHHLPLAIDFEGLENASGGSKKFLSNLSFSGGPMDLIEDPQLTASNWRERLQLSFSVNTAYEYFTKSKIFPPEDLKAAILTNFFAFYSTLYDSFEACQSALSVLEKNFGALPLAGAGEALHALRERIAFIYSGFRLDHYLNGLKDLGLQIYGSIDWRKYVVGCNEDARRLSEAEFYELLKGSKMTFCQTKLQFDQFVHERIMMALACGSLPLTDYREEIFQIFEKDEVATYQNLEEAREKVDFFLNNDAVRIAAIQKGRERVLRDHTYLNRVDSLKKMVGLH